MMVRKVNNGITEILCDMKIMGEGMLSQLQQIPLKEKIIYSVERIQEFIEAGNNPYQADSGGLDSTALRHIIDTHFKEIPKTFADTGIEFPEIRDYILPRADYVVKPKKRYPEIIKSHGYPVVSKEVSMGLNRWKNTKSEVQKSLRLHGGVNPTSGKKQARSVPKKWHFLCNASFKISEACCYYLKKEPMKRFEKETGRRPIIGTRASESNTRRKQWLKIGCNTFGEASQCRPLSIWTGKDVIDYISTNNIEYSPLYDMGYDRSGCYTCMFGMGQEQRPDRFDTMKRTHPKIFTFCMDKLGLREIIKFVHDREYAT